MEEYSKQHKKAWEFDAYNFWVEHAGKPEERAKEDAANPRAMLRRYADYFDRFEGVKVANICGSCGKKAIPLALLGADVTIGGFLLGNLIPVTIGNLIGGALFIPVFYYLIYKD